MYNLLIGIFGLVIGSFLNVCIVRLPARESILFPGSHCPKCGLSLKWYHNIPVLSYLMLGGRCAYCQIKISLGYPIVEILTAAITIFTFNFYGFTAACLFYTVFIYFLIVIAFIDWQTGLIHNTTLIALLIFGVLVNLIAPVRDWVDSFWGFVLGGGCTFLLAVLGKFLFKRDSMGMGDVKLAATAGFFLGTKTILIALYAGFVIALFFIIGIRYLKKSSTPDLIPMGPFLAVGLIIFLFWGEKLIQLYWKLFI